MSTDRIVELVKKAKAEYGDDYLVLGIPGFLSKNFMAYCSMREDLKIILE